MDTAPDDMKWVPEARMLEICGVPRSTYQSWARENLAELRPDGAYREDDVITTALIAGLRAQLPLKDAAKVWAYLRRTGRAKELICLARNLGTEAAYDLVIQPAGGLVSLATNDEELAAEVRASQGRALVVLSLAEEIRRVRQAFEVLAELRLPSKVRRRGRPRKEATVHELRAVR